MRPSLRVLGSLTICATVALWAADRARAQVFRSSIDLVHVTVTVRDADGRLIDGLTRDDFEVFEDGKLQTVTQFQDGRVPVSLALYRLWKKYLTNGRGPGKVSDKRKV